MKKLGDIPERVAQNLQVEAQADGRLLRVRIGWGSLVFRVVGCDATTPESKAQELAEKINAAAKALENTPRIFDGIVSARAHGAFITLHERSGATELQVTEAYTSSGIRIARLSAQVVLDLLGVAQGEVP